MPRQLVTFHWEREYRFSLILKYNHFVWNNNRYSQQSWWQRAKRISQLPLVFLLQSWKFGHLIARVLLKAHCSDKGTLLFLLLVRGSPSQWARDETSQSRQNNKSIEIWSSVVQYAERVHLSAKKVCMFGFFILILDRHICLINIRKVILSLTLIKPQETTCSR